MRIVIAVDDSCHSERAVEFVTQMRWPAGSRMIVVSVVQPVALAEMSLGGAAALLSPDVEEERSLNVKSVVSRAEHLLRAAGFSVEGRVLHGDPRLALLAFTEDERADLLVLGSHGRTGLAKLLIGSVSSHCVTHAPCSVLVIKDTTQPPLKLQTPSAPRSNAPTD